MTLRRSWLLIPCLLAACAEAPPPMGPAPVAGAAPAHGPLRSLLATGPTSPTPAPAPPGAVTALRLISRPGGATATSGTALRAVDGNPLTVWSPAGLPQSLAVPLLVHSERTLVVAWHSAAYHYLNTGAAPRNYALEVSSDSTDGRNGRWTLAKQVSDNPTRSRADTLDAPGARWVRLRCLTRWAMGPHLSELTVHAAASPARLDAWLILGDSITAQSFDPAKANSFAGVVASRVPPYRPVLVPGGTGGDTAIDGEGKLNIGLGLCPPGSFVGLAYGTNDATRSVPVATFKAKLQAMVTRIKASGRTPMLARTSWNLNGQLPAYVRAIDDVTLANKLPAGPDLYTYFRAHPEELKADRVHMTAVGERTVQRLWGEAAAKAYRR